MRRGLIWRKERRHRKCDKLGATAGRNAAMIKDIVVNLSVGKDGDPAGDYAVSVAGL